MANKDSRSTFHHGQVSESDTKSASARVAMDDFGSKVSGKFQVLFPAIGGWNVFFVPKKGDHVVMSRLPNGTEEGHILGKVYTANKMPQRGRPNILLLVSDDGKNVIEFDADKGTLELIVDQGAALKFKDLDIETKEGIKAKAGTAIKVEAGSDIDHTAGGKFLFENKEDNLCRLLIGIIDLIIGHRDLAGHVTNPAYILSDLIPFKTRIQALLKG
jgi:phage baseplate assembly protein gpV